MKNTSLVITVPHLSSPISAFGAESKSYILALRFNNNVFFCLLFSVFCYLSFTTLTNGVTN